MVCRSISSATQNSDIIGYGQELTAPYWPINQITVQNCKVNDSRNPPSAKLVNYKPWVAAANVHEIDNTVTRTPPVPPTLPPIFVVSHPAKWSALPVNTWAHILDTKMSKKIIRPAGMRLGPEDQGPANGSLSITADWSGAGFNQQTGDMAHKGSGHANWDGGIYVKNWNTGVGRTLMRTALYTNKEVAASQARYVKLGKTRVSAGDAYYPPGDVEFPTADGWIDGRPMPHHTYDGLIVCEETNEFIWAGRYYWHLKMSNTEDMLPEITQVPAGWAIGEHGAYDDRLKIWFRCGTMNNDPWIIRRYNPVTRTALPNVRMNLKPNASYHFSYYAQGEILETDGLREYVIYDQHTKTAFAVQVADPTKQRIIPMSGDIPITDRLRIGSCRWKNKILSLTVSGRLWTMDAQGVCKYIHIDGRVPVDSTMSNASLINGVYGRLQYWERNDVVILATGWAANDCVVRLVA